MEKRLGSAFQVRKSPAEEIAGKLCESVAASLEGKKLASFSSISSTVQTAMEEALTRILTPKRSIDILRDVYVAKDQGRPYVVVFVGVNGVGKSTNLAKVAYWLLQHDVSVMIAACDTFRSGAVEQLRTHARRLQIPIFEKGYKKAIQEASRDGFDVVLVDTAGRMQIFLCPLHVRMMFQLEILYPFLKWTCLGTLRDQIIYPLSRKEAELRALEKSGKDNKTDDAAHLLDMQLICIIENVRLVYLLEREQGWDANMNWEDVLSLGERQRLGMARLFFHSPKYGILDECTNATSIDVEEHLYRLANEKGITFITSSQRPAIPFHSTELLLIDGEGNWELRVIKH